MNSNLTIKLKRTKIKRGDFLFFLAYGLFLIAGILSTSYYYKYYIGTPHKVMIFVVFLLLVYKELYENRLTNRAFVTCILSVVLVLMVNYIASASFAVMFVLIWSARNIEFERIARFTLIISGILFAFIIFSAYVGIIENTIRGGIRNRHYLGFRYALFGSAILYNIISLYIYLRKQQLKVMEVVFLGTINYWVYEQTDSRLSFGLGMMVLFIAVILKYFPLIFNKMRLLNRGMLFAFPICAAISIGITTAYDSSKAWMELLNVILGSRLRLGNRAILEWGYTMFGQNVSWHGWGLDVNGAVSELSIMDYNYVDCGYLNLVLHYGVIVFAICMIVLTVAMFRGYRKKNYYLLILLTFVALHAMIDDLIIYLYYNTLWFVAAARIESYVECVKAKSGGVLGENPR